MRRLLTWLVMTAGIAALVKRLRRREPEPSAGEAGSATADPADELRRKLAESRAESESEPEATPGPAEASVEDRRASVHGQGRAALDEMTPSDEEPS